MARPLYNVSIVTGTLNGVSATSVTGNSIFLGQTDQATEGGIDAHVIVTAATASLTAKAYWQVSPDNTTFTTLANLLNGADIAIVTGIANKTLDIPAPPGINKYKFARCLLLIGGATGAAGDLFSIGYNYRSVV